jgi:tRNA threonylcarbamoyladenosine biosynthesis protein TsaE
MQKTIVSKNIPETTRLAGELIKNTDQHVFFLYGDLGSGKTTFAQGVGEALGITQKMQSPTFIIMRSYELSSQKWNMLYHVDLYRIESMHQIEEIGILDLMQDPKNLFLIEWPERMQQFSPPNRVELHFIYEDEEVRKIVVKEYHETS